MSTGSEFESLLARAARGNEQSITELWLAHQPRLLAWLRAFVPAIAEDVASETWIDALRSIERFSGDESNFRSWLFTIARRRAIDRQRKDARRRDLAVDRVPEVADVDNPSEARAAVEEMNRSVELVRSTLAPDQAEVVLLRVLGGLDTDQVAVVLGKKPGTVRVLQHRGLRRLAEILNSRDDGVTQ